MDRYGYMAYFGGNLNFVQSSNFEGNFMDRLLSIVPYHTRLFNLYFWKFEWLEQSIMFPTH